MGFQVKIIKGQSEAGADGSPSVSRCLVLEKENIHFSTCLFQVCPLTLRPAGTSRRRLATDAASGSENVRLSGMA